MRRPIVLGLLLPSMVCGQKFLPDDPLEAEPPPVSVAAAESRRPGEYYDFFRSTFSKPGERNSAAQRIPARNANTLGEVMNGAWYVNRHYRRRLSIPGLVRGPGNDMPPSKQGAWKVVSAKTEGVTPGFTIEDSAGRKYMIKFDPLANLELATAAEMVGARFFHALGYYVPETYLVYFERDQLEIAAGTKVRVAGKTRPMRKRDLDEIFFGVPRDPRGGYRAVACRYLDGKILGPFLYEGTRSDDPNDLVPHEHRRELRGLFVFAAWLGHNDIKCLNTVDSLVRVNGVSFLRHHLIDFGASLGSDSFTTKSPRAGYEYLFRWRPTLAQVFSVGFYVPKWARADYPHFSSVGNFEYEIFEPEEWKPNYPATIFDNRLPEDNFWAARQVMWFTDEEIRAVVKTGEYSDSRAEEWMAECLIERRYKIGKAYFSASLPLDRFRVEQGRLAFDDLGVSSGFTPPRNYTVLWSSFDNNTEKHSRIDGTRGTTLPPEIQQATAGSYFAARITLDDEARSVTVFLRRTKAGVDIVGVERTS